MDSFAPPGTGPVPSDLRDQVVEHHIVVSSFGRDRDKYPTPSSYWVELPSELLQVRSVRLIAADIPFHAPYLVGEARARSEIPIRLGDGSSPPGGAAVLPPGDYPGGTGEIASRTATVLESSVGGGFAVSHDPMLDSFSFSSGTPFQLDWKSRPDLWNTARILGFATGALYASVPDGSSGRHVLRAPFRCSMRKADTTAVVRLMPNAENTESSLPALHRAFTILRPTDDMVDHPQFHLKSWSTPLGRVSKLMISLVDAYDGLPIDFQNADHRIELIVTTSRHRTSE